MHSRLVICLFYILASLLPAGFGIAASSAAEPLNVVVMDPLSAPLSCDCVKGYAQRKYEKLGEFLEKKLGRKVVVTWSESLDKTLRETTNGKADLIIGKHSVVLYDAKKSGFDVNPIAALTDSKGKTTQTGLFVVRKDDPARTMADLAGYRIFFGPEDCAEKHAAPIELLKKHKVALPKKIEVEATCSTAAKALLELDPDVKAAAVISSYAEPLLAGCGTIKKGDLRVIGVSAEVPFIVAFMPTRGDKGLAASMREALLEVGEHSDLLRALETDDGFVAFSDTPKPAARAAAAAEGTGAGAAVDAAAKKK
jgi:ABC-type phosphate/phosphonate transport system substrate-binding protein